MNARLEKEHSDANTLSQCHTIHNVFGVIYSGLDALLMLPSNQFEAFYLIFGWLCPGFEALVK